MVHLACRLDRPKLVRLRCLCRSEPPVRVITAGRSHECPSTPGVAAVPPTAPSPAWSVVCWRRGGGCPHRRICDAGRCGAAAAGQPVGRADPGQSAAGCGLRRGGRPAGRPGQQDRGRHRAPEERHGAQGRAGEQGRRRSAGRAIGRGRRPVRRHTGAGRRRCGRRGHRGRQGQGRRLRGGVVPAGFGAGVDERVHGRRQRDRICCSGRNCSARCPESQLNVIGNLESTRTHKANLDSAARAALDAANAAQARADEAKAAADAAQQQAQESLRSGQDQLAALQAQHEQQQADYGAALATGRRPAEPAASSTTSGWRRSRPRKRRPARPPSRPRGSRPSEAARQAAAEAAAGRPQRSGGRAPSTPPPSRPPEKPLPPQAAEQEAAAERASAAQEASQPGRPRGAGQAGRADYRAVLRQL